MFTSKIADSEQQENKSVRTPEIIFFIYLGLIVYGSLFPFHPWVNPRGPFWSLTHFPQYVSKSDLLANVLVYLPVGLLFVWIRNEQRPRILIIQAVAVGGCLSLTMESLQIFLPRDSSAIDLIANTAGTAAGAVSAAVIRARPRPAKTLLRWKANSFAQTTATDLGLTALCLWIATQVFPFVPSFDVSTVRGSLSPAWQAIHNHAGLQMFDYMTYSTAVGSLALLISYLSTNRLRIMGLLSFVFGTTFALKPLIVTRALSLEALAGLATGLVIAWFVAQTRVGSWMAGCLIVVNVILLETAPEPGPFHTFNWIPFYGQGVTPLIGLVSILGLIWQPIAFCSLLLACRGVRTSRKTMWIGATFAGVFGLLLEALQQHIPGRYPEITPSFLWAATWLLCWKWAIGRKEVLKDLRQTTT